MKEYLSVLFLVCAVAGVVKTVSPENATKKYIEMLCSLCVIGAVVSPIMQGAVSADGLEELFAADKIEESVDYDEIYNSYLAEGRISEAEEALSTELGQRFEKEKGTMAVELGANVVDGEIVLSKAAVRIAPSAVDVDPEQIKSYIVERTGVKCEIIYDF